MAARPYWSGQIRLSLVSLPVNIYSAIKRSRQIPLHEIYRRTGERVHHQNVASGGPIDREDIIKGYEYQKGEYVLLEPEEIAKLKVPSKKVLDIVEFVPSDAIDVIYSDTPYFVVPDGKAAEDAFVVIREALRETKRTGIGQLAIGGRERLCSIRPCGSGILLETLRYEDEIRQADPYFEDIDVKKIDKEELDLAKELIKRKSATFKPERFHDHYREALQELIDAKLEHRKPREVVEERKPGQVINLMDALRKSLKEPPGKTPGHSRPKKAKSTSKSSKHRRAS